MTPGARLSAVIELLEPFFSEMRSFHSAPADARLGDYFRKRRYIGAKDKGEISRLFYAILRHQAALEYRIRPMATPDARLMLLAWLAIYEKVPVASFRDLCTGRDYSPAPLSSHEARTLVAATEIREKELPAPALYNYPEWLDASLKAQFGERLGEEMQALNQEASLDLRVNLLKTDVATLAATLSAEGFAPAQTPYSPWGLRLEKRGPIFNSPAFKDGMFEVQDEASQLVALLCDAKPGEKIIDFCAGAGGKTLALAMTMKNKGRILACDTSASRLAQLEKRMRRAGVHNTTAVAIASEQDSYLKRHRSSADCVLVDAPCSGSGTWRRNPDLKWRLSPESLEELMRLQQNILMQASRLVKPGGRLVYATCSLLQEENERQLQNFTQNCQDFRVASLGKIWNNLGSGLDGQQGTVMKTTPCKHQMDGFFAAVLVREPSSSPLPAGDNQPVT